jgi:hypothetical protein
MKRYVLLCFFLVSLSWGQAKSSRSEAPAQQPGPAPIVRAETATSDPSQEGVSSDNPLITIVGFCDKPSGDKGPASNCKTVITEGQFERVIKAIQPGMPPRARREFALSYANALVMARKAEQMGLDRGENYEEQMNLARIQVLSQDLKRAIQEKASQISENDIDAYYHDNTAKFEKAEVDRIYVPKRQQPSSTVDKRVGDAGKGGHAPESGQTMKEEAENLRARAVAGEDFTRLQADAYQVAGIKSVAPNTSMEIRRASLPPDQTLVMDLKPGQVSPVLPDPNGYMIYKIRTKDLIPLDQAREEIKGVMRSQRLQGEMHAIEDSVTPILDESYFARSRSLQGMTGVTEPAKTASSRQSNKSDQ